MSDRIIRGNIIRQNHFVFHLRQQSCYMTITPLSSLFPQNISYSYSYLVAWHCGHLISHEDLLRILNPLHLNFLLFPIQIIGQCAQCTVTEKQIDLFQRQFFGFLRKSAVGKGIGFAHKLTL
jgi:hypothetical protein